MRIAVTGSQSFIGKRLIALARERAIEIFGIDCLAGADTAAAVDVRDRKLAAILPERLDAVVHLAAVSRDGDCRNEPIEAFDVNVGGTLNVAQACIDQQARQLIFASSEWVYGEIESDGVQVEGQPIDATRIGGEYALSKLVGERVLAMASGRGLRNVTVLRFGIVYGPRETNWSAVESLFFKAATEPSITVGSLATARRFIHVDDIASGILAAIGRKGFEVFNLSADRLVTLGEIIEASIRIHGTTPAVTETDPSNPSIRSPDNTKAKRELGWRPMIDLERGLKSLGGAPVSA
jgi:nucleoside-diphosphate-sugar epimerase